MQLKGLVDGGEVVEAVGAWRAYGEAKIYFAEGADAGGHQAAACREDAGIGLQEAKIGCVSLPPSAVLSHKPTLPARFSSADVGNAAISQRGWVK
jgi:hypothetical protein